ncbi:MAG: DUF971 domain-containing protein [Euryarchaeota archaeon]|jgi:DUF971 family protein|nr:DUF971 domain-containing protein [Euryarchaeota archaeon]
MTSLPSLKELERRETDMILRYADDTEYIVDYITLRLRCPCANCDPRRDTEGRLTEFEAEVQLQRNEKPSIEKSGHFGLQFKWDGSGCNSGIFGFDLLHSIAKSCADE